MVRSEGLLCEGIITTKTQRREDFSLRDLFVSFVSLWLVSATGLI